MPKRHSISTDETTLKRRFGATVRQYRQRLAVSQEELAWRAEMHRTYLADVERGARNVSLSSVARLVNAIGVSLREFFASFDALELAPATAARGGQKRGRSAANPCTTRRRRR